MTFAYFTRVLFALAAILPPSAAFSQGIVVDHTCTDVGLIPDTWIEQAKTLKLHYAHTSNGSQLVTGAEVLMGQDPRFSVVVNVSETPGLPPAETPPALRVYDGNPGNTYVTPDLYWDGIVGLNNTRAVAITGEYGYSMWAWCGEVSIADAAYIQSYLDALNQLESENPAMRFVYMTGHLDGTGESGNLHQRNNQIRAYCLANNKVLFDFADIESYDPSGNYYLNRGGGIGDDGCQYDSGNWATEWCTAHLGDPLCAGCGSDGCCAHSQHLNCNLKGRAFWWLMTRLAGWEGTGPADPTPTPTPTPTAGSLLDARPSSNSPAAGDRFTVNVNVQPLAQTFDAWGVVFGPGGALYSFVLGNPGALAAGARPLARNVPGLGSPYAGVLLDMPAIPQGTQGLYQVVVGLVPAGTAPAGIGDAIPRYADQESVTVR